MKSKFLIYLLTLILLLPGNIYLVYHYFICGLAKHADVMLEGNENNFLYRWKNNAASLLVENGNIVSVGGVSQKSFFSWAVIGGYFVLNCNNAMAVDYNQDFLTDYIRRPDGKMYIQLNGKFILIEKIDLINKTVTFPDGKAMVWKNNRWQ